MKTFYQSSTDAVFSAVQSDKNGLSASEVTKRLQTHGRNELSASKPINPFALFIGQFKDLLIIILLISATVSLGLSFVPQETDRLTTYDGKLAYITKHSISNECQLVAHTKGDGDAICPLLFEAPEQLASRTSDIVIQERESPKESLLIYAIVVAIALIGFFNEYKAEKTVEALKKLVGHKAKVRRGGQVVEVDAGEIVPGDIVLLDEGQKVPADLRLYEVRSLNINEASLTGESVPVSKNTDELSKTVPLGDQKCLAFAGTFVTSGTAEGIVVATAQQTELGKIADLVNSVESDITPMQKKLDDLGKKLGLFILLICIVVFAVVFFWVEGEAARALLPRLIFAFTAAVALAVAAIPEGLAFVVRISLALGARRMAAKNALVRKLSAVEALGSTDIICSDKTGTLTKGEMTVRTVYSGMESFELQGTGYTPQGELQQNGKKATPTTALQELVKIGVLCNNAHLKNDTVLGDPTEGALIVSGAKLNLDHTELTSQLARVDEIPFTSERKLMTTVHKAGKEHFVASKGAVEVILAHCTQYMSADGTIKKLDEATRQAILSQNSQYASRALRVLGFASKTVSSLPKSETAVESDLVFVGLQAIMDPPRKEVIEVIHRVQAESGMRVIMITGDYAETAKAIAQEIGIKGDVISGPELDELTQEEFEKDVEKYAVYARVNPEHKIRIVRALKKHGHQVAMTGDGVNDAPAIKAADIGIAMGITGTDAAKEAADLILLDDQFLTIINAIEEGRGIFDNVRKFVNFLISCNIAEVLAVLFGIIFFNNLILTAAQLLFINIVTDGLPAIALGSDPAQANALKAKPKRFQESILTTRVWAEIFVFGTLMTIALLLQYWYNQTHEGSVAAVSAAFTAMVVYEIVRLVDIRTDYKIKWFSNPWLSIAMVSSLAMQFAVLYIPPVANYFGVGPLSAHDWVFMAVGSVILFTVMKLLNPLFDRIIKQPEISTY